MCGPSQKAIVFVDSVWYDSDGKSAVKAAETRRCCCLDCCLHPTPPLSDTTSINSTTNTTSATAAPARYDRGTGAIPL